VNPDHPRNDIVDHALEALLATTGPDEPPAHTVEQVRREITDRQAMPRARSAASARRRDRLSWPALAMTVLLMLGTGWTVAFHDALLSQVAGQQISADGTIRVFLSDGRVELRSSRDM